MIPQQQQLFRGWLGKLDQLGLRGRKTAERLYRLIVQRKCRGRLIGARCWSPSRWAWELGDPDLDGRIAHRLIAVGILRVEGDDLVWVDFDSRTEDIARRFEERQRRLSRAGNAARWGHRDPDRDPDRVDTVNLAKSLTRPHPDGIPHGSRPPEITLQRSIRSGSGIPEASSTAHSGSGVLSASRRVALASGGAVANKILRRRGEGPAPDAPPARLSARAGQKQRDVRQGAAGQGNGAGGDFPDFGRWYDMYRGRTGKPFKRARAEQLWLLLRMTVTERRQLWRFTDLRLRRYSAEHPAPNPFAFLEHVWMRNLRQIRASHRKGDPFTVAELLAATMGQQLEGRA